MHQPPPAYRIEEFPYRTLPPLCNCYFPAALALFLNQLKYNVKFKKILEMRDYETVCSVATLNRLCSESFLSVNKSLLESDPKTLPATTPMGLPFVQQIES